MKTIYFTCITLLTGSLFCSTIFAQQAIQANLGSINRATPKIGFNTNGHMPPDKPVIGYLGANWTQQAFRDSTASLNPQILRYPGGTNANHWDWQTGWYRPGYQPPFSLTIRPEEFQVGLNTVNQAEGLYVMNLETSTATYEMDGLRHMNALALNPTMIELGNEHNLQNGNLPLQYMTSVGYAQLAKTYYDSIKAINPTAKVCVVGSNTQGRPTWNADILTANPNIEAFAWHAYTNANNIDLVFDVNRAFAEAFADVNHSGSLAFRYNHGGFNLLPSNKEVWVTEYNLWETQQTTAPVIAESWTHTLYLTAMHDYFLRQTNVTMFLNHSLASIDAWHESISKEDHHITANGIGMKLLLDVSKGSQTAQDISFAGNPTITYGSTTFPKLLGWKFTHATKETGFICNFSLDTFKISLSQVFSNAMDFTTFTADTNFIVNGISSLNQFSGSSTDSITILPYSFTQITSNPSSAKIATLSTTNFSLYPNPVNDVLHFSTSMCNFKIYNIQGKLILDQQENTSEVHTNAWENGVYLLVKNNEIQRFVVQH